MTKEKTLTPSMEDYLETIWLIKKKVGVVRVRDIAKAREVALPSVNNALKNLSKLHLVKHDKYEFVELTPKGNLAAKKIYDRHLILTEFLKEILGVDKETAEADACKIEHTLSSESLEKLIKFMDFIRTCPSEMKFSKESEVSLRKRKSPAKNDERKEKKK
jgi:DtxR family Mn-dependent transcriptional regulator